MYVLACRIELHLPVAQSLKEKRAVLRPMIERMRNKHGLAVAEVDHQEKWQRAVLGVAAVGPSVRQASELIDQAERLVWSRPDVDVLAAERQWLETA